MENVTVFCSKCISDEVIVSITLTPLMEVQFYQTVLDKANDVLS